MADVEDREKSGKRSAKPKADGLHASPEAPESHAALARKYRPKVFAELIGQEAMVRTLRNAFASARIAQAYMLTGVRGVGKTTTARLIARALNYEGNGASGPTLDMTEEGVHCRAILESRHLDVVEMDAASHTGIDDIRDLIDSAHYKPNTARYKVYIIDEVHMLSKQAFNGLLKTLEEPPEHVKFIFATTEARKVPVTVLSRCQRFDLKRIEIGELIDHLKRVTEQEGATAEQGALALIARAAEGSVRDALSILDRAIAFGAGNVETDAVRGLLGLADRTRIFDLLETVLSGDAGAALQQLAQLNRDGAEPGQVIADLADAVHAVTLVKAAGEGSADPASSEAEHAPPISPRGSPCRRLPAPGRCCSRDMRRCARAPARSRPPTWFWSGLLMPRTCHHPGSSPATCATARDQAKRRRPLPRRRPSTVASQPLPRPRPLRRSLLHRLARIRSLTRRTRRLRRSLRHHRSSEASRTSWLSPRPSAI
jgi:DNA polymerase III subunit gamma/tau